METKKVKACKRLPSTSTIIEMLETSIERLKATIYNLQQENQQLKSKLAQYEKTSIR